MSPKLSDVIRAQRKVSEESLPVALSVWVTKSTTMQRPPAGVIEMTRFVFSVAPSHVACSCDVWHDEYAAWKQLIALTSVDVSLTPVEISTVPQSPVLALVSATANGSVGAESAAAGRATAMKPLPKNVNAATAATKMVRMREVNTVGLPFIWLASTNGVLIARDEGFRER